MLRLLTDPVDSIYPTNGCKTALCFDETEYLVTAGEKGVMKICHDGVQVPVFGTKIYIAGHTFEITGESSLVGDPNYIYIAPPGGASQYLSSLKQSLEANVFFSDSYDITEDGSCVTLTTKTVREATEFDNTELVTSESGFERGADVGEIETNGVNDIVKDDYYVFLRIIDMETGKAVCTELNKPLNVLSDGSNKACFELSAIISKLPSIKVSDPDDSLPLHSFDTTQQRSFGIQAYGMYNFFDGCGKRQTPFVVVGNLAEMSDGITFVRFIEQPDSDYRLDSDYKGTTDQEEPKRWMTDKPETYEVCKDAPLMFRHYRDVSSYPSANNGGLRFRGTMTFTDGSTQDYEVQCLDVSSSVILSPIHIINISAILYDSGIFNQDKVFDQLVFQLDFKDDSEWEFATEEYTLLFDNDPQGNCCEEHDNFIFVGETGNNDVIISRADIAIEMEMEFAKSGVNQVCGEYNGGVVDYTSIKQLEKKSCWIYCEDFDYLMKFLASPIKWKRKDIPGGSTEFVRIYPAEGSYEVYKKYRAGRVRFTYFESLVKNKY